MTGDDAVSAIFVKPGINLALNLKHNFQVVGGVGSYAFVSDAEDRNDVSYDIAAWKDLFTNRTGASMFIGVRVGF